MMKVTLIAPEGLKEKYLREAADEYIKRLRGFCDLKIAEFSPFKLPDKPNESQIAAALDREAEQILKRIPAGSRTVALCIEGKMLSSEELAGEIRAADNSGTPFTFIMGSSHGLAEQVKRSADIRLSFSKMTFPHQLFRVLLLEQLYRAYKINSGGAYHK